MCGVKTHNRKISYNRSALAYAILSRVARLIIGRSRALDWVNGKNTNLWQNILNVANPACVISTHPGLGLCRAGKMKGIPIYDFQHGVINDQHPWYGKNYRANMMPRDLVDGFLCWDEQSASTLRKWAPQKGIVVKVVGNPWFSRFMYPAPDDLLVQEALGAGHIFSNGRPNVLVSLQWGMMVSSASNDGFMVDALKKTILETSDSFNWLLRLHPVQMRGPEKKISFNYLINTFGHLNSVEWQQSSELPLPVILNQTDLHVTDSSTVVVEAAWLGIRSAVLNIDISPGGVAESYFFYERDIGLAEVVPPETNAIKQWLSDTYKKGRGDSTLKHTRKALHAFINDIESLLSHR
jgi:hypothetical protein